jgi:DNA-binding transcriptional ArsR family regulator
MKPQDIVILLKIMLKDGEDWRMTDIAASLKLSQSEISKSLKRLEKARLYHSTTRKVAKSAFYELLIYGVPYFFPIDTGKLSKGVPTSISHEYFKGKIITENQYVWPHLEGKTKGETVSPLYPGAADAALTDKKLYSLLALIDVLRIGRAREINLARAELKTRILG